MSRRLENLPLFARFTELTQAVRREGAAALDLCYVACGRFDGYWERGVSAWDVAAASIILERAGGRLTDYAGTPLDFDTFGREIVASNTHLHAPMLAVIANITTSHTP
jgi:myo-inositol-1(or 4)-monophosphatase